ncbi:hypothetical protein AB685_28305 [Bacillus sp. LL01]|uniref:hypothetical protein n=1 Tax=Bacillus sp. LL01 TaxID=1665556 RepID=UPI00064D0644|nr:hypothetical protein [Bacillus sp. LL01]KMJ55235.1 hypothetical protein AB685_28305 [Bacillus sp. LL01]
MSQFTAQSIMIFSELKNSLITFWSILTGFILFFFLLVIFLDIPTMFVLTTPPMYVFIAIFCYRLMSAGDFSHSIHLGVTRKAFVLMITLFTILLSLSFALLNQLYIFIMNFIQPFVIENEVTFFMWSTILSTGNEFMINILADSLIMSTLGMLLFLLASLSFRFGQWAMLSPLAIVVLLLFIPAIHTPIIDWIIALPGSTQYVAELFTLLLITLTLGVLSYFTLSKASV